MYILIFNRRTSLRVLGLELVCQNVVVMLVSWLPKISKVRVMLKGETRVYMVERCNLIVWGFGVSREGKLWCYPWC